MEKPKGKFIVGEIGVELVGIDASMFIKFYNKGVEDAFVSLCEFHDLETTLNERGIDGEAED